jgi:hypothetical protein
LNLFAYTENEPAPAYFSLNRNNYDTPVLSVRTRDQSTVSYITMPNVELRKLHAALTEYLDKVDAE